MALWQSLIGCCPHVPIMPYTALKHHLKPSSETLSPRESREHQPQGLHNRRGGMVGKLNDPKAKKKSLRCDWNAVTARLGDACETDLSGYFPQDLQGQILERPIRARGRAGTRARGAEVLARVGGVGVDSRARRREL